MCTNGDRRRCSRMYAGVKNSAAACTTTQQHVQQRDTKAATCTTKSYTCNRMYNKETQAQPQRPTPLSVRAGCENFCCFVVQFSYLQYMCACSCFPADVMYFGTIEGAIWKWTQSQQPVVIAHIGNESCGMLSIVCFVRFVA